MRKFFLPLVLLCTLASSSFSQVSQGDFEALVAIYNATDGDNWTNNTNWNINGQAADVTSDWYGVTVEGGRVTKLRLRGNNLVGEIPIEIGSLSGLVRLQLYSNSIISVPTEIGMLTQLDELDLDDNDLTSVPSEIGDLISLTVLWLNRNNLTELPSEIGKLTNLQDLYLNDNNFTELIDLSSLTTLTNLRVENNQLDFGDLELINNKASYFKYSPQQVKMGVNRQETVNNVTLTCLIEGTNNQFQWYKNGIEIPVANNKYISLSNQESAVYSCEVTNPDFPDLTLWSVSEVVNAVNGVIANDYEAMVAFYNATGGDNWSNNTNWLSDQPVSEWYGVTVEGGRVTSVNLNNNNLVGDIPSEIGKLSSLTYLSLEGNYITSLPSQIGELNSLVSLHLYGNDITNLPSQIGDLSSLVILSVSENNLVSLPIELSKLTQLEGLYLSNNDLNSMVDLSSLSKLYILYIDNNNLDFGDFESINKKVTNFSYSPQSKLPLNRQESDESITLTIDVDGTKNQYQWYKNGVEIIDATSNIIDVSADESATYYCVVKNPDYPELILLSENEEVNLVNGVIAMDYDALIALYNATEGNSWKYNDNWLSDKPVNEWNGVTVSGGRVIKLNLYNNNVKGNIPKEIGDLTGLTFLMLSQNEIESIPSEIGNLFALEKLYLSSNKIKKIPVGVGRLGALTDLKLSNNKITSIPVEIGQLVKLTYLSLSNNQIASFPKEIINLTSLGALYFASNQISELPSDLGNLVNIGVLDLSNNQIRTLPSSITDLYWITDLYVDQNKLDSLFDLSDLTGLQYFKLENNNLDFGDLETVGNYPFGIEYSPQAEVPLSMKVSNATTSIYCNIGGANNQYQWYKNEVKIEGETDNSIDIEPDQSASYYCEITNPDFQGLTLQSETILLPFGISQAEYDALVALYNSTHGDSWTDHTSWLTNTPISDWYGVEVNGAHVVSIMLDDNNLTGIIPDEIGDLKYLTMLGLTKGSLTGTIPASIGELSSLTYLGLSRNQLTDSVPGEVRQLTNLQDLILFNNEFEHLPDLSSLANLNMLSVSNNRLTFEDIEPNLGVAAMDFYYSPQATVGEKKPVYMAIGENEKLGISVGGDNNVYQWYKDGVAIANTNFDSLSIVDFSIEDAGEYYCTITNTLATALTLQTDTFSVVATYPVSIIVSDKNGVMEKVEVGIANLGKFLTDANGSTTFQKVPYNTELEYFINSIGHETINGTINIHSDTTINIQLIITGLEDVNSHQTKIYPNPSTGNFVIQLDKQPSENCQVDIIDLAGHKVFTKQLSDSHNELSLEANLRGTFILRIVEDGQVVDIQKVVFVE